MTERKVATRIELPFEERKWIAILRAFGNSKCVCKYTTKQIFIKLFFVPSTPIPHTLFALS